MTGELEQFEYPESSNRVSPKSFLGWEQGSERDFSRGAGLVSFKGTAPSDEESAQQKQQSFEAGRMQGFAEGRAAERGAAAREIAAASDKSIHQATKLLRDFEQERGRYFQQVEEEVVKLALAVAARILRREAQTDPLLLMGAVRVALGQVAASTEVRIRVPDDQLDLWKEALAILPNLRTKPEVIPADGMKLGECVMETSLGIADLGIASQLREIECKLRTERAAGSLRYGAEADVTGVRE